MPVRVITNDRIALLGAARCALVKTRRSVSDSKCRLKLKFAF